MSASNLDAYDLSIVNLNGVIAEDVMSQIWDVSKIPLPFTDMVGSGTHSNQYFEWRVDKLQSQDFDNAQVDGSEQTGNDTKTGRRMGNHSQISTKRVEVSTRAQEVNTIGYANALAYQVTQRQQELRRDVEGMALMRRGSRAGTDTLSGLVAGLPSWLTTRDIDGSALGTTENVYTGAGWIPGGWDATPGNGLVAAPTAGTPEALTETKVRDVVQSIYQQGGKDMGYYMGMTTPAVKSLFSQYLFTSSARIASLIADGGGSASERQGSGSVDVFMTDFGVLKLVPNRLQPSVGALPTDGLNDAFYVIDPSLIEISYLQGYRTEPLAKTGLYDVRLMSVDWSLCVKNWDGLGMVPDIDPTAAVTFA